MVSALVYLQYSTALTIGGNDNGFRVAACGATPKAYALKTIPLASSQSRTRGATECLRFAGRADGVLSDATHLASRLSHSKVVKGARLAAKRPVAAVLDGCNFLCLSSSVQDCTSHESGHARASTDA